MAEVPNRAIRRLQRPSWRDGRFIAGVLLVAASVVAGSLIVSSARSTTGMLVATTEIAPGEPVTSSNTSRIEVQLGDRTPQYLSASTSLQGTVAVRPVRQGELIPVSALGRGAAATESMVTINADAASAQPLVRGSVVDVYAAAAVAGSQGTYKGARRLLQSVTVAATPEQSGFGQAGDTSAVRLAVPTKAVVGLIDHVDNGSRITLVPVPGSLLRDEP